MFFQLYQYCLTTKWNKRLKLLHLFLVPIQSRLFPLFNLFPQISDSLMKSGAPRKANERRPGFGVQEWDDGSIYEGEFINGLKHGKGKYTWKTGEVRAKSFRPVILGNFYILGNKYLE